MYSPSPGCSRPRKRAAPKSMLALAMCCQVVSPSTPAWHPSRITQRTPAGSIARQRRGAPPSYPAFAALPTKAHRGWTLPRSRRRRRVAWTSYGGDVGAGVDPQGSAFGTNKSRMIKFRCLPTASLQPHSLSTWRSHSIGGTRSNSREKTALRAVKLGVDDGTKDNTDEGTVVIQREGAVDSSGHMSSEPPRGWEYWGYRALLLGVAAIWGTNFPVVKFVENHAAVADASAAFVRFTVAAGALLPFVDWSEREVLIAGMETGIWVAMGYFTQAIGLQTSNASVCAFLCSLTVVFVPLIDTLAGRGIKMVTIVASLLALLGTGFLELGDAQSSWNDLWCVAQAVGFGVAFTRIETYMKRFPGKSLQLSIGQLISVACLTGIWCAVSSGGHLPDFSFMRDPAIAGALGYTGLITTSLAVWLETIALEHVPASEMSVIFSTEPLWATLVSVLFLNERMGSNAAVGAAFILLACLTAQSEQIMDLMGVGRGGTESSTEALGGEEDAGKEAGKAGKESGNRQVESAQDFPLSVLDELDVDPDLELDRSLSLSLLDELSVPVNAHADTSTFSGRASNFSNTPAYRRGWLGSVITDDKI